MRLIHILGVLTFTLLHCSLFAQDNFLPSADAQFYIAKYKDLAMQEMERTGIPASITLAQGLFESGFGKSDLASKSNNHFGIKCKSYWRGERVYHDDDTKGECFRKYKSVEESYIDHSNFLKGNERYAKLFMYSVSNYKAWAHGLKKAGYATNPVYATKLIKIIEDYHLNQFTPTYWAKVKKSKGLEGGLLAERNVIQELEASSLKIESLDTIVEELQYVTVSNAEEDPFVLSALSTNNEANKEILPVLVSRVYDKFEVGKRIKVNQVPAICLPKGFSLLQLADTYDIPLAKIYSYNDIPFQQYRNDLLHRKMLIYLAPKKGRASSATHRVRNGESLHDISQIYGIKLKRILRLNRLKWGETPSVEQTIYLQRFAPSKPNLDT